MGKKLLKNYWAEVEFYLNEGSYKSATEFVVNNVFNLVEQLPDVDHIEDAYLRECRVFSTFADMIRKIPDDMVLVPKSAIAMIKDTLNIAIERSKDQVAEIAQLKFQLSELQKRFDVD